MNTVTSTLQHLWSYYRYEVNNGGNKNNGDCYRMNNEKITASKSFECKIKIVVNLLYGTDIGLPRQTNTTISQQVNFTEKYEKNDGKTTSFIT